MSKHQAALDPILFELMRNAFVGLVDEVGDVLEKAAFSVVVNQARDSSAAICDADGRLVSDGERDLPGHVGTLPFTVQGSMDWIGRGRLREGDIVIMNDPFIGGTHCQDVRTLMPVFWEGELIAFVVNSAHWTDCGGPIPGSFNAKARSTLQEALLITPIHLVRGGDLDTEVLRLLLRNVRTAEITRGDVMAQLEACRTGEARLHELCVKYGGDAVRQEMRGLLDYSERLLRHELAQVRDGTYSWSDYVDRDPGRDSEDFVKVHIDLTIEGDSATVDLSKSDPQALGAINATRSLTTSAVMVSLKAVFAHVPANDGMRRAVSIEIPDGLVVSAGYPAPISGAFSSVFEKVLSCMLGCLIQVVPHRAMACEGNLENLCIGGFDPRPGREREYVLYQWMEGGYGGRPGKKDNYTAQALFASGSKNVPVEFQEREHPVLYHSYSLLPDSEGAGEHRGSFGVLREFSLTHGAGTLSILGDRGRRGAWGFEGGLDGMPNGLVYGQGTSEELDIGMHNADVSVQAGVPLRFWEGGGGGWSDPLNRRTDWILDDVVNGLVSLDRARDVYGVVIEADGGGHYGIDEAATAARRESMRHPKP